MALDYLQEADSNAEDQSTIIDRKEGEWFDRLAALDWLKGLAS